jgi:hypothetical protein
MKQIFFTTILTLLFSSCNLISNHSHDGKYKSNVFNDATLSWVHTEIIELDGNTMSVKSISIIDSSILSEFKTECTQYNDRVEFKNKNGIVQIARFDGNGNLKYGEYTYKIQNEDPSSTQSNSVTGTEKKSAKLIKEKNNETKETSDDDLSLLGSFLEDTSINPEYYNLYKKNGILTIKNANSNQEEIICKGSIRKDGRIIDSNNVETIFKYKNHFLYKLKNGNWIKFVDQTDEM